MADNHDENGWEISEVFEVKPDATITQEVPPTAVVETQPDPVVTQRTSRQITSSSVPPPVFIRYPVNDPKALEWAKSRLKMNFRDDANWISKQVNDEIVGCVVFDTFGPNDCLVHVVSDGSRRWMSREFIVRAMAYPFIQLKFRRITCMVADTNKDSILLTQGFGWTPEGRMRAAADDGSDLWLFGMLRSECHWLNATRKRGAARI